MSLRLLHASAFLQVFHDTDHDWLYLDWRGALTLDVAQAGWLALTRCLLVRPYGRVLNSNAQVTHVDPTIRRWMLNGFERFMRVSGINQLAWVHAPSVSGLSFAESVAAALPRLSIALFADEEQAATWLKQYGQRVAAPSWPPLAAPAHAPDALSRLRHLAQALARGAASPPLPPPAAYA